MVDITEAEGGHGFEPEIDVPANLELPEVRFGKDVEGSAPGDQT